jgi:hypothetical protein
VKDGTACDADTACPGANCVHCKPFGGDGCAANCTLETDITFDLVPGQVDSNDIRPGTSGIVIHGDILNLVALSGRQALTIGKAANGLIPVVIKAASIRFPAMHLVSLSCFCLRGVAAKTCGGTLLEADGVTPATDCTETFAPGDSVCAGKKPCTFVYGPGNAAGGVIGCEGLDAVDVTVVRDCGATPGAPPAAPAVVATSAIAGPGSARLWMSTALGSVVGLCNGTAPEYGPDGEFCTSDDPVTVRGSVSTFPITTGSVTASVLNSSDTAGATLGPFSANGAPFSCVNLGDAQVSGAALVGSFTACDQPTVGDAAFAYSFVAR